MSDKSAIEWTDATWNPVTGCTKVSPGCAHCYIERTPPFRMAGRKFERGSTNILVHLDRLEVPLHWRRPRRVFVNALSDLFHEVLPETFVASVFAVMAMAQEHTFQVLTKRPDRMERLLTSDALRAVVSAEILRLCGAGFDGAPIDPRTTHGWPLPNVWLGVSAENQRFFDERVQILTKTPAALRFVSAEPLLGDIDMQLALSAPNIDYPRIGVDWLIAGGESGPGARPMDLAWARSLRDQCADYDIAFFMKQLGGSKAGSKLEDLPEDLRVREFPVPGLAARYGAGDGT
jgi:protein gp37